MGGPKSGNSVVISVKREDGGSEIPIFVELDVKGDAS